MELNRCAYTILGIMRTKGAVDKVHGLTISEISALEKVSRPNTIHKKVKEMEEANYVTEGIKVGRAKSYCLTSKGQSILPIKKENVNV